MRGIIILTCIFLQHYSAAQKIDNSSYFRDVNSESYFRINYENDLFYKSDKNYTQGFSIELISPSFRKNPLNYLFYKSELADIRYGLIVEHNSFTPIRYDYEDIQYGERPFASTLTFKSFSIVSDTIKTSRIISSINIGVIGPFAFGDDVQTSIHKVTGSATPRGWRHQIENDIVLNYNVSFEKRLLKYRNLFSLQSNTNGKLGTLYTNATVGFNAMLGKINTSFSSIDRSTDFGLYLYAQPLLNLIGYDATLQGGLINRESPYTISSDNINRFTGQLNFGIVLKIKSLYIEYSSTILTKEITTGTASKWAGIRLGVIL